MATELVMPRLSDSMEEGTIIQWLKSVGDEVAVGDELVEIETDKANMVYEADAAGTLVEIVANEGDTLPIGETIARVGSPDEAGAAAEAAGPVAAEPSPEAPDTSSDEAAAAAGPVATDDSPVSPEDGEPGGATMPRHPPSGELPDESPATVDREEAGGRVKASPLARRMAADEGVDLASINGSGPGGRVIKADVEKVAAAGGAPAGSAGAPSSGATAGPTGVTGPAAGDVGTAKGQVQIVELTKLQQTVGRRMAESKATAPHFYLTTEIDMSRCVSARAQIKASSGEGEVVPSFNDMVIKACALALREFPVANGSYKDGHWELYSRVNIGIAVAAQDALVVPTIFDADLKGLRQIATDARALAGRVRDGSVTPPELSGGTFTVSNLGMYGITEFAAVINPPQAGILAVGAITETPVVSGGKIATAHMMKVTLACDHRILYGADGAEFLAAVRAKLEEPLALAL